MRIVIPSSPYVHAFARFVGPLLDLEQNLLEVIHRLKASRDLLLPSLISGEIDVENLEIDTSGLAA